MTIKQLNFFFAAILITTFLFSCKSSAPGVKTELRYENSNQFDRTSEFYLFESDMSDYYYEVIGPIETTGNEFSNGQDVLNEFCLKAWSKGANAIIGMEHGYLLKSEKDQLLGDPDLQYDLEIYRGTAVRIAIDEEFIEKHEGREMYFLIDNSKGQKKGGSRIVSTILCASLSVALAIVRVDYDED